jgi:hypothetical protein
VYRLRKRKSSQSPKKGSRTIERERERERECYVLILIKAFADSLLLRVRERVSFCEKVSSASPTLPSDKDRMEMKRFWWLEQVA